MVECIISFYSSLIHSLSLVFTFIIERLGDRAEPGTPDMDTVLREIYVLYADCALVSSYVV
jgi:hypothetical protein